MFHLHIYSHKPTWIHIPKYNKPPCTYIHTYIHIYIHSHTETLIFVGSNYALARFFRLKLVITFQWWSSWLQAEEDKMKCLQFSSGSPLQATSSPSFLTSAPACPNTFYFCTSGNQLEKSQMFISFLPDLFSFSSVFSLFFPQIEFFYCIIFNLYRVYIYIYIYIWFGLVWFGLVWFLLFNGISTFVGYLIPKPSFLMNSSGTI